MSRQSLSRAIRRSNAVIVFNEVFKTNEVIYKRGETYKRWRYALKNQLTDEQKKYCSNVTKPLSRGIINNSKRKIIYV